MLSVEIMIPSPNGRRHCLLSQRSAGSWHLQEAAAAIPIGANVRLRLVSLPSKSNSPKFIPRYLQSFGSKGVILTCTGILCLSEGIEDSKAVIKKEDGNVSSSSSVTIDLDEHASDIELMIC